ncbi:MAG: ribonuclease R [Clostridia bacterium]|mgnify:CR=1 FL=1|nr:ribonuclease R [Clostridia bacterium]
MGNKKKRKYEGIFRANEKGYGFVEFEVEDMEDVFIPSKSVNGALNGDTVLINIFKPKTNERRAEGKIVKVLKRDKDTIVGIFQKSRNFGFVVPDDKKFDTDIFISKNKCLNARNNDKVVAKIIKYPEKGKNAEGEIVEVLGNIDLAGVDMLSVIKEFDLPNEFPLPVTLEAMGIPQEIDKKDIKNRKDFRDIHPIFTIDGEDAKDLDDAVFVQKNEDGTYLLEVHIADVSYYVKEDSILDKEAIKRGTSVYMFDRVVPMLPFELSNGICSLNAGEDRFALSCIMKIDSSGNVISSDVCKSVIRVTERMSYTDVYKIITNSDEEIVKKYEKYISCFKDMEELAHILKDRRLKQGYLNLDIPESKIVLDGNGKAIEVKKYELNFANEIIEQFMLTANETVAEKFYWLEAPFIYRVHEKPELEKINEANKFLFNIGYKIKASKDNIRPKAFAEVLEKIKDTEYEKVISTLILRALKIARYEAENKGHFGIASKYYCHFTSPIRRYPDLFIHRIISEYIKNGYHLNEEHIQELEGKAIKYAESSSDCEKIATKAEREAEDIKKAEFMEDKIGEEFDGIISSITSFGMFVELESTVEGLIRFENMGANEYYIYDENRKTLVGEKSNRVFKIGDKVKIRVIEANKLIRKIAFELVEEN